MAFTLKDFPTLLSLLQLDEGFLDVRNQVLGDETRFHRFDNFIRPRFDLIPMFREFLVNEIRLTLSFLINLFGVLSDFAQFVPIVFFCNNSTFGTLAFELFPDRLRGNIVCAESYLSLVEGVFLDPLVHVPTGSFVGVLFCTNPLVFRLNIEDPALLTFVHQSDAEFCLFDPFFCCLDRLIRRLLLFPNQLQLFGE